MGEINEARRGVCAECEWFLVMLHSGKGECRRFPPRHQQQGRAFPVVDEMDWCGEYRQFETDDESLPCETESCEQCTREATEKPNG